MSEMLGRVVKAQRIEFIVKYMIDSKLQGEQRFLLDEWLGELTEDLLNDLKSAGRQKPLSGQGLTS